MSMVNGKTLHIGKVRIQGIKFSSIVKMFLILAYLFLLLLPIIYVVLNAFKPLDEMFIYPPRWIPKNFTLTNFSKMSDLLAETVIPLSRYLYNSILYCVLTVAAVIVTAFMAAFSMAKTKPKGSSKMIDILIFALSLSGPAAGVANFIIIEKMGLLNTYWAIILPAMGSATYVFLIRQFLVSMPDSYVEAARLDGAGEWQIMWKIGFPYAKPAVATVIVYQFMAAWSDATGPAIYINDASKQTLPVAIATFGGSLTTQGASAALTRLMLIPSTLVFVAMQSKIVSTMSFAGLKE